MNNRLFPAGFREAGKTGPDHRLERLSILGFFSHFWMD
jgi:hypothetical protein